MTAAAASALSWGALFSLFGAASADAGGTRWAVPARAAAFCLMLNYQPFASAPAAQPFKCSGPACSGHRTDTGAAPGSCSGAVGGVLIRTADCRPEQASISCSGGGNTAASRGTVGAADKLLCCGKTHPHPVEQPAAPEPVQQPSVPPVQEKRQTLYPASSDKTVQEIAPFRTGEQVVQLRKKTPCCTPTCASQKPISTVPVC